MLNSFGPQSPADLVTSVNVPLPLLWKRWLWPTAVTKMSSKPSLS